MMMTMKVRIRMTDHHAATVVNAPIDQVYALFTHFNDFPKFIRFVKEVTYYDDMHTHWVADIAGRHEWDAVNTGWDPKRQIGWTSTDGLENYGMLTFLPHGPNQTKVLVTISYNPPGGIIGDIGEALGGGKRFDAALQADLSNFARKVEDNPGGALDPQSSTYLFHDESAAARGETTDAQNRIME
jgi:uncharacterized membrane protein